MLRLITFGAPALVRDGVPHVGPATQRRRLALLALVAAHGERGVPREQLLARLWPASGPDRARHALQQALHAIESALGADDLFLGSETLSLNHERISSDVGDFAEAIASRELEHAVAVYAGSFLEGFLLDDAPELERWVDDARRRLAREHADALETLASTAEARNDHYTAAMWWRRLAAAEPLSARVAIGLITSLAADGDRAGALQAAAVHEALVRQEPDRTPDAGVLELAARLARPPELDLPHA